MIKVTQFPGMLKQRHYYNDNDGVEFHYQFDSIDGIQEGGNGSHHLHVWLEGTKYTFISDGWGQSLIITNDNVDDEHIDGNDFIPGNPDVCFDDIERDCILDYVEKITGSVDIAGDYMSMEGNWTMKDGNLQQDN